MPKRTDVNGAMASGNRRNKAAGDVTGSGQAHSNASNGIVNAMSVDVEDYFQVSAFSDLVARSTWETQECRVERNVDHILQLFEDAKAHATFFTLGWVAERYPDVVRRIVAAGHELASHGYDHTQVFKQTADEFRADVTRTKALLEDVGGAHVQGYRAASFSIDGRTPWAFEVLQETGHAYSSSVYPIQHDHYGMPDAPRFVYRPGGGTSLPELPLTTLRLMGRNLPCAGGGYFRLLPYAVSRWSVRRVNRREGQSSIFYFHPWEVDPDQPRFPSTPPRTRFRHYVNLRRMSARLRALLADFTWDRVDRVFEIEPAHPAASSTAHAAE